MAYRVVGQNDSSSRESGGILLVDDDEVFVYAMRQFFSGKGVTVLTAASADEAIGLVKKNAVKLALLDINLSNGELGFKFLQYIKAGHLHVPVIMLTSSRDLKHAINALRLGAADYLLKPVGLSEIWDKIQGILNMPSSSGGVVIDESIWAQLGLVGISTPLAEVYKHVTMAAKTNLNILITGETGTGKELCASALHMLSGQNTGPFVPVNCAALGESVFQAEMFGYKKGSFTGADETRKGYIEAAEGGTLFLDEIGEVPLAAQAKLLRVIESGEFNPVGETQAKKANVRYIAATNRNLQDEVASGRFREDLYYRLNVMEIHLPALRERREDIPTLVEHNIAQLSQGLGKQVKGVSPALMSALMGYSWPGNVRQLLNMLARAIALSKSDVLERADFPILVDERRKAQRVLSSGSEAQSFVRELEYEGINVALLQARGDTNLAAFMLKVNRATLYRKIKKYGIDIGQFRHP